MKKPVVDYRRFRLSKLNEPEFSHMKLLGGWIVYFILYFVTENLIPMERHHVIHCALDDMIPFHEGFLILYCYWYALLIFSLGYFLLYDLKSFKRLQIYIIVTQAVAMIAYIVYPSIQLMRPEHFARDNILTKLMAFIYWFDTPTGVCPSLHVAYSFGIASAWWHRRESGHWTRAIVLLSAVLISISTAFVKQHSVLDIAAALPVCALAEFLVFGPTRIRAWIERSGQR